MNSMDSINHFRDNAEPSTFQKIAAVVSFFTLVAVSATVFMRHYA